MDATGKLSIILVYRGGGRVTDDELAGARAYAASAHGSVRFRLARDFIARDAEAADIVVTDHAAIRTHYEAQKVKVVSSSVLRPKPPARKKATAKKTTAKKTTE